MVRIRTSSSMYRWAKIIYRFKEEVYLVFIVGWGTVNKHSCKCIKLFTFSNFTCWSSIFSLDFQLEYPQDNSSEFASNPVEDGKCAQFLFSYIFLLGRELGTIFLLDWWKEPRRNRTFPPPATSHLPHLLLPFLPSDHRSKILLQRVLCFVSIL